MTIDFSKHKEAYLNEARANINAMNQGLVEYEKNPQNKTLHKIFRSAHTLKSLAAAMGYEQTIILCHAIEDILDLLRHGQISLDKCIEILFKAFDYLTLSTKNITLNKPELETKFLVKQFKKLIQTNTLNVQVNDIPEQKELDITEKLNAIEVKVERLDTLMNLAEELLVNKMRFDSMREAIEHSDFTPALESLGRLITDLQYYVMQVRLVPVEFIFTRFLRLARDLAKQQKKEVELYIQGGDIELDRLLIDELGESIAHLIKNAIDHGLETPEVRKNMNKPLRGKIGLIASRTKDSVIIEIRDDGAGLNFAALKNIGLKRKLIKPNASEQEIKNLIFLDISTKKIVTEVSGRGLGLSIVKQKIESTGGAISVNSEEGKGTTFTIEIPLSLAIIKTLFVNVGNEIFAIPVDFVERLLVVSEPEFRGIIRKEAIIHEDSTIPIIRLADLFKIPSEHKGKKPIVIITKDGNRVGLVADALVSTQEVVIKPLSKPLIQNKFFSGAAMIGSGHMILIIDAAYLCSEVSLCN